MLTTKPNPKYKNKSYEDPIYNLSMDRLSLGSSNRSDQSFDEKKNTSIVKVHHHPHHQNKKKKEKDGKVDKQKTKLKKQKHKSLSNSESLTRDKSMANINENKELKLKHSKSKSILRSPSTPTLHRSPSKEYLPIASNTQIPLTIPLTSLVPSINLPFSPTPPTNKKVILNPIIPHPPIKPIKNDKIFSRKRYSVVPTSSSIVTSSKLS